MLRCQRTYFYLNDKDVSILGFSKERHSFSDGPMLKGLPALFNFARGNGEAIVDIVGNVIRVKVPPR